MKASLCFTLSVWLLTFCSADNCLKWTPWINGDSPGGGGPLGGGDFETVGYDNAWEDGRVGRVTKKLEAMGITCTNPLKIECREARSGVPWFRAGDDTKFPSRMNCEASRGLACVANRQADGSCHDYEVRLLCWTECPQLAWTSWTNRDRPSGNCDCEHPGWADHPARNAPACPDGQSPVEIQCQTTSGQPASSGPDPVTKCSVDGGFSCFNSKQPGGRCRADYRVRYLCFNQQSSPPRSPAKKGAGPIVPVHSLFPTF